MIKENYKFDYLGAIEDELRSVKRKLISRKEAEKQCQIYKLLAKADKIGIFRVFDSIFESSAIVKGYCSLVLDECIRRDRITEEQAQSIRSLMCEVIDCYGAEEAFEVFYSD